MKCYRPLQIVINTKVPTSLKFPSSLRDGECQTMPPQSSCVPQERSLQPRSTTSTSSEDREGTTTAFKTNAANRSKTTAQRERAYNVGSTCSHVSRKNLHFTSPADSQSLQPFHDFSPITAPNHLTNNLPVPETTKTCIQRLRRLRQAMARSVNLSLYSTRSRPLSATSTFLGPRTIVNPSRQSYERRAEASYLAGFMNLELKGQGRADQSKGVRTTIDGNWEEGRGSTRIASMHQTIDFPHHRFSSLISSHTIPHDKPSSQPVAPSSPEAECIRAARRKTSRAVKRR